MGEESFRQAGASFLRRLFTAVLSQRLFDQTEARETLRPGATR